MAMKSSSVCALEPEKITKTKWIQYYGTPCRYRLLPIELLLYLDGILVTGTSPVHHGRTSEFITSNGSICTLIPQLPRAKNLHTQSGLTACGGNGYVWKSCYTLINGVWETSHSNLLQERRAGLSWNSPEGIILLGGTSSKRTSELLSSTSDASTEKFRLTYDTQ